MSNTIPDSAIKQMFTEARTHNGWLADPVSDETLREIYDMAKFGPTSANCSPLRIVFVKTKSAKEKLKPALMDGNVEKSMTAPVVAILAQDMKFYDHLPMLFPHADAKSWFVGNEALIAETAMRNSTLQAAYFMLAARACGVDCGPMSGFDKEKVDLAFFAGTSFKSNFLCSLGHGDTSKLFPRSPRFRFEDICQIL